MNMSYILCVSEWYCQYHILTGYLRRNYNKLSQLLNEVDLNDQKQNIMYLTFKSIQENEIP